jgi:hypothetical protein
MKGLIRMKAGLKLIFVSNFNTYWYDESKNLYEESQKTGEMTVIDTKQLITIADINKCLCYLPDFIEFRGIWSQ